MTWRGAKSSSRKSDNYRFLTPGLWSDRRLRSETGQCDFGGKKVLKRLLAVAALSSGWFMSPNVPADDSVRKTVDFTILHINDVYEIERPGDQRLGGLSRVAQIRRKLVEQNPHTLTVLAGDALSPSPLSSALIDGEEMAGRQMVSVLNVLGLDFATFGNHEFDLKKDQLWQRVRESTFTWVSSNVTDSFKQPLPGVARDVVLRIANETGCEVRVGLIGLTIDSTRPDYVRFEDPLEAARERVSKLRKSCDVIIALTHLAIDQDRRLAAAIPQIHLILGGHEHQNSYECRSVPGAYSAPIVKADSNAKTVAVHRLMFDSETRRVSIHSRLVPVVGALDPDPLTGEVRDVVDRRTDVLVRFWKERCYRGLKNSFGYDPSEVVAESDVVLDGLDSSVRFGSTNLTKLIGEAMKAKVPKARAAIYNCGSIRIDDLLGPGPIRVYDVFRILPYEGKIVGADLDGRLLMDLLDRGESMPDEGGFLQIVGIARENKGRWEIGGNPIQPGETYLVAIADFLLSGNEKAYGDLRDPKSINGRLNQVWKKLPDDVKKLKPDRTDDDREMRHAVVDYIKSSKAHIQTPPESVASRRPLPAKDIEHPVVELVVDPPSNLAVGAGGSDRNLTQKGKLMNNLALPLLLLGAIWGLFSPMLKAIEMMNERRDRILDPASKLAVWHRQLILYSDWLTIFAAAYAFVAFIGLLVYYSPDFVDVDGQGPPGGTHAIYRWTGAILCISSFVGFASGFFDFRAMKRYLAQLEKSSPPKNRN